MGNNSVSLIGQEAKVWSSKGYGIKVKGTHRTIYIVQYSSEKNDREVHFTAGSERVPGSGWAQAMVEDHFPGLRG